MAHGQDWTEFESLMRGETVLCSSRWNRQTRFDDKCYNDNYDNRHKQDELEHHAGPTPLQSPPPQFSSTGHVSQVKWWMKCPSPTSMLKAIHKCSVPRRENEDVWFVARMMELGEALPQPNYANRFSLGSRCEVDDPVGMFETRRCSVVVTIFCGCLWRCKQLDHATSIRKLSELDLS